MDYKSKILTLEEMISERKRIRSDGKTLVFTNGCFDIMHAGHIDYLTFAKNQGDLLMIGLNSDISIKRIKGQQRPIINQKNRAKMLTALEIVDYVTIFDEDEPINLISEILPDILIKGKDWEHYVSGREIVEKNGGKIILADLTEGISSTSIINKILNTSWDQD